MKLHFDDGELDAQLQRTAAKLAWRASDLGEVFAVAGRIDPGDYESWYHEWYAAGEANRQLGDQHRDSGHRQGACDAYLRASEYFRSAYFFWRRDPTDQMLLDAWRRCRDAFREALPLLPFPGERLEIPYEDVHLEGYLLRPREDAEPRATVLMPCGYDSPVEEFYTLGAYEAVIRGYNAVGFSGPGQAEMLYERGIPFRHDYEVVISQVIDFLEERSEVDGTRVAIMGRSFGGYLAPRAASREHRLAALTADPAQTDMFAAFAQRFPPAWIDLVKDDDRAFNDELWKAFPGVHGREYWLSRARAHGCATPLDYVREMKRWVVDVESIACPAFVSYGEGDFAQATTKEFYDRLRVPKEFRVFREADGAGGHCEGMGQSRYFTDLFAWLDQLW